MVFELAQAQRRLAATEHARMLLSQALAVLHAAGVKNAGVLSTLIACQEELSDYKHVTLFAIRKREDREKESKRCRRSVSW